MTSSNAAHALSATTERAAAIGCARYTENAMDRAWLF
jgi:hypothetical protein